MTENSSRGNEVRRGMNLEEAMEILDVVQGDYEVKFKAVELWESLREWLRG